MGVIHLPNSAQRPGVPENGWGRRSRSVSTHSCPLCQRHRDYESRREGQGCIIPHLQRKVPSCADHERQAQPLEQSEQKDQRTVPRGASSLNCTEERKRQVTESPSSSGVRTQAAPRMPVPLLSVPTRSFVHLRHPSHAYTPAEVPFVSELCENGGKAQ